MSTTTPYTEAGTSRRARIKNGDLELQLHFNDTEVGDETVVLIHGSGPGPAAGPTSIATWSRWLRRATASS